MESTFEGKTDRLKNLREREIRLDERIRELRRQHEEFKQTEENYHSNNKMLNRLMEVKRNGEIPGILGRLVRKLILSKKEFIYFFLRAIWVELMRNTK